MIKAIANSISENKDWLTGLDAAIGDGDHGANLANGFDKAKEKAVGHDLPSEVFKEVAMTLMSAVGGSSGPLFGSFFVKMAMKFRSERDVSPELFGEAFSDGVNGIISLGRASLGDKTMLDALIPACEAYKSALAEKSDMARALTKASEAAKRGAEDTIPLIAKRGRASFLGENSKGHKDPGAASSALIIEAMLKAVG
ncbi:MAG: dihydroxyacetone kinase subunit DhaL [Synergistaceae bacterium]|nr:dihydroxyacetone kinase subunit DhaL [Synergistaceae bacterium]